MLVLRGAKRKDITSIDLYSNIPSIQIMDFHNITFPPNSFDIVFWAGSFAYAKDFKLAASQALKVIKNEGIIALGDSLLGQATREVLLEGLPSVKSFMDEVPSTVTKFTQSLNNVNEMIGHFSQNSIKVDVVLTRKYLPSHANVIMKVNKGSM